MTTTANRTRHAVFRQVRLDLTAFPGRLAIAWRVGALCALMAMVAMIYGIPESAISCYLILFVMKPDKWESIVMALAVAILVSLLIGLLLLMLPYTLAYPAVRMLVLVGSSFLFLWLGSASKLGPVGSIIALVIAFIMTLLGDAPNGELATRAVLYAWLMAVSPMLLLILFNLLLGRSSWKSLCRRLAERLNAAADALQQPDEATLDSVREWLREGQQEHQQRIMLIRLFRLRPAAQMDWLEATIASSYRLLLATAALAPTLPAAEREALAGHCRNVAESLQAGQTNQEPVPTGESEIHAALRALAHPDRRDVAAGGKSAFFAEDALSNPVHIRFALKTTAASVICYFIYTVLDWQDIHTAMITCYVAVLGTTGETVHKLSLRIVGCLIGAFLGIFSLMYIVPALTDIGQLMLLVFAALTLSAWVSSGNERIAYAGIQIGLAFLLTVLHGYSPSTDLDVAFDRIAGILLGNLVVYLIFTQIWPVPIVSSVRARIHDAVTALGRLAALPPDSRAESTREASEVEAHLASAEALMKLTMFEPRALRPGLEENQRLRSILSEIGSLCPPLFLPISRPPSDIAVLSSLSGEIGNPSSAPHGSDAPHGPSSSGDEVDMTVQQHIIRLKELLG